MKQPVRARRVGLVSLCQHRVATVTFREYVPQFLLNEVRRFFPGRYYDPGNRRWIVPLHTVTDARRFLSWAISRRFRIDPKLTDAVADATHSAAEMHALAREV